ncbi:globin-coupled sensor protein [Bacillus sp. 31A1R]|uniref:Globin-coupled sensor protein n=1 Tax=Robertmurraya mangrovi TaxID=3098077 RepID=A0ABU5J3Q7_9BACI|nr:globin-coupled sensor protein [Bacillus sp. 31A1R]MDZ5473971.1 globin-coupled sensor protein [Bacillus sp. 31A1R]
MGRTTFLKKRINKQSLLEQSLQSAGVLGVTSLSNNLKTQLKMIQLDELDLKVAKTLQPFVQKNIDTIVAGFYKNLENQPSLMNIISSNSTVDRLKQTLRKHLIELFDGKIDAEFVEKRIRIAHVHVRIGLETQWYMCAFQDLLLSLISIIEEEYSSKDDILLAIRTVTKLISIEQQLVLEAYEKENERLRNEFEEKQNFVKTGLNETVESLSVAMEQTNDSIQELAAQADQISSIYKDNTELSKNTSLKSIEGKKQLENQNEHMQTINSKVIDISKELERLQSISQDISLIVGIVTNIAEQTNLLALNAAIEAARAGESGKGFSVVASEVRKLAEETKVSVSKVTGLISMNNNQITNVTEKLSEINHIVDEGIKGMVGANEYFDIIIKDMKNSQGKNSLMETEITEVSHALSSISSATHEISASIDSLREVSKSLIQE